MREIQNKTGIAPQTREEFIIRDKALAGDMVFKVSPATKVKAPTAAAWEEKVVVTLETAAGERHTWFNKSIASGQSIADTSTAGTASIESTTIDFENGQAIVTINGDAAAWLNTETVTYTVKAATILGETVGAKTNVITFTT